MTILNLPVDYSSVELANDDDDKNVRWKRILPMNGSVVYGNQKLTFTKELMERLKNNYDAKIIDQTAFQLATDSNSHDSLDDIATRRNFSPERYRGEVKELKIVDNGTDKDGFWAKFKLTDEGVKLIENNPGLGVSPSIKPDYIDGEGKAHDFVLRHVVGTLDPKVKKMGAWQSGEILLTSDNDKDEEVFGLTAPADTQTPDTSQDEKPQLSVDKAEYEQMQTQLAEYAKGEQLLEQVIAEVDAEDELVNLTQREDPRITELQNRAAASEWRAARAEYVKDGVPNKLLNLCDEVMSVYEAPTINLSDGSEVDPRATIKALLDESKGLVDLSAEGGHGMSVDERKAESDAADEFINGFMGHYNVDLF